jgi:HTH-type transcriptional regulator / antitoxin HigA
VQANRLAANWLIDPMALESFVMKNQPRCSRDVIEEFAQGQKKHPGIILGRLYKDQLVPHKNLRGLLAKVSSSYALFRSFPEPILL